MTSGESHDEPPRVDLSKNEPGQADEPFDPYRFGKPDTPPPPEYAPPGYVPDSPPPQYPPLAGGPPPASQGAPSYPNAPYPNTPYPGGSYPGSYPGAPPPYGQPPVPPGGNPYPGYDVPQGNGKAVAGMVLGILAIVFCWTTLFDLVLLVPAVIFSALGLGVAKTNGRGRGQAIAGLICSAVAVVLAVVLLVFLVHVAGKCSGVDHSGGAYDRCIRNQI